MFDISFSEILVIAVVAMVVIGPKRLPKTVRTLGLLMGRAQRYVGEIKADIQREMELEELKKVQQSMQDIGKDIEQSVKSVIQDTEKTVKQTEDSVREMGSELNHLVNDESAGEEAQTTVASDVDTDSTAATAAAAEVEAEPSVTVPSFLQGEVALSIPDASPETHQKSDA